MLLHKQQTSYVFGTRQSPSVDKPATRLMWKSQYVPYDGIPFVNAGHTAPLVLTKDVFELVNKVD